MVARNNNLFIFNFNMKKFLLKSVLFVVPIIVMQVFFMQCHTNTKGDLLRLGFLPDMFPAYRDVFSEYFGAERKFVKISDDPEQKTFDVFTIGDSFSEQNVFGYQNFLASEYNFSVLHYDRSLHWNPIHTLYGLVNSDFFEHYQVKYVVLQTVERYTSEYALQADSSFFFSTEQIRNLVQEGKTNSHQQKKQVIDLEKYFPSAETVTVLMNVIRLSVFKNQIFNKMVHKVLLSESVFSNGAKHLLFYVEDIQAIELNNNIENMKKMNNHLNILHTKLQQKGVTLIYLPCPDKFDFYYEYIVKCKYDEPLFFKHLREMEKDYLFIDSKQSLKELSEDTKDVYFYDDTHWSPYSSKHIASIIASLMQKTHKID